MSDACHAACDPLVREGARTVAGATAVARGGLAVPFLDAASARGYFTPDEDEALRVRYAQYLGVRGALLSTVAELEQACSPRMGGWERRLPAFAVAFAAACLLLRQARSLAALAGGHPLLAKKLDEPSALHGIPRKTFTALFRATTDPARLMQFREAVLFYERHRSSIADLAGDPELASAIDLLETEDEWIERRKRDILRRRLAYGWHSFIRRHRSAWKQSVFGVFEWSGRAISELRQPGVKPPGAPKRITPELREKILRLAKPGDIFVTRHDDAMTNLFLPGYWPHVAFFIGSESQRAEIGLEIPAGAGDPVVFLEAKKDGVRFRPVTDTLEVDAFVILRPPLEAGDIAASLARGMRHEGKPYDFAFDFRDSDRLVCTEVIYRSYHGAGPLAFSLVETGGRICLPAEELIAQSLAQGFRVVAACGVGKEGIVLGTRAELVLHAVRSAL
ncbi:YiiX/YebB-like N1pC/P60 family cysteine hydrolase [Luteolibacter flavescens]|uniref:YiiX/YebB-like N1pC/P60 family cysteine hydrolase n=1 Tax=Luteolibacter flavescens TaxID=1859460 RepID=A0ABT3FL17_9BACT|nr:YiiX/YebB-like N1pC/P60 family cysteine hydrolase [Luteolibacter flavescens]MCW1883941.1 YiiX/YebB-like N1pC/P60 family cysteine hydrolase [Luteolibacter flavescens]